MQRLINECKRKGFWLRDVINGLPQHIPLDASASCAPIPVDHINPFNGYKVILFVSFRRSPYQVDILPEHSAQLLCHWGDHTADYWIGCGNHRQLALLSRILSMLLHQCLIASMHLSHKEAREEWASCRVWLPTKMLVALCLNKVSYFGMPLYKIYTMYSILRHRQYVLVF